MNWDTIERMTTIQERSKSLHNFTAELARFEPLGYEAALNSPRYNPAIKEIELTSSVISMPCSLTLQTVTISIKKYTRSSNKKSYGPRSVPQNDLLKKSLNNNTACYFLCQVSIGNEAPEKARLLAIVRMLPLQQIHILRYWIPRIKSRSHPI